MTTSIVIRVLVLNAVSSVAVSLTILARRPGKPSASPAQYRLVTVPAGPHVLPVGHAVHVVHRRPTRGRYPGGRGRGQPGRHRLRPPPPPTTTMMQPQPIRTISTNHVDDHEPEFPPVEDEGSFPTFGRESPFLGKVVSTTAPPPPTEDESEFTPVQMYLQVRQTNQVKHVPQSEAVKDATTLEEVVNAPRLKELLRTTRVREVYSEEGYEDAGYDHGGHIRHAEHDEGYTARDQGVFKIREKNIDEERSGPQKKPDQSTEPAAAVVATAESKIITIAPVRPPKEYTGEHKYSSRIRGPEPPTPTEFWVVPTVFDSLPTATSPKGFDVFALSAANQTATVPTPPKSKKRFKYSRHHAKYPKRDRFRLAKLNEGEDHLILPTIGYINSLTTAHFGKGGESVEDRGKGEGLTRRMNLTEALEYMRSSREMDAADFEAMKVRSRREAEEDEDDGEAPEDGDEEHEDVAEEEKKKTREEAEEERSRYEENLRAELDQEEKDIVGAALGKFKLDDEEEEGLEDDDTADDDNEELKVTTTPKPIDTVKYPFYYSKNIHEGSPLRYATDPRSFPRKTGPGMVFYESRDKLISCPEVRPDLSDIPRRNATLETENGDRKRLAGLGDKIRCLRAKYFDEDPLDSPFFREDEVDYVGRKPKVEGEKPADKLEYHSTYEYRPNRTLDILVRAPTEKDRVIPVTEVMTDTTTPAPAVTRRRSGYHRSGARPMPRSKLVLPHDCMSVIGKMAGLNGMKNLVIDCPDAVLIQEVRDDVRYLRIMPKSPTKATTTTASPTLRRRAGRRRRDIQDPPLRLSLRDFFLLLQRGKPFQLPRTTTTTTTTTTEEPFRLVAEASQEEEIVRLGGQFIRGHDGRELVYISVNGEDVGQWIVTKERDGPKKSLAKLYKKYGKGKGAVG